MLELRSKDVSALAGNPETGLTRPKFELATWRHGQGVNFFGGIGSFAWGIAKNSKPLMVGGGAALVSNIASRVLEQRGDAKSINLSHVATTAGLASLTIGLGYKLLKGR